MKQLGRSAGSILMSLLVASALAAAVACTPSDKALLEGLLQNVDAVNGQIAIVTKDGKTITLKIATEAPVQGRGASPALEGLEPGTNVKVKVDEKRQVVERVEARLAKVEGTIVGIDGAKVTVESERGRQTMVTVTERTRIKLEDDLSGKLADLRVGAKAKIKFDPETLVALKIGTEEEEAEIEGAIVEVKGDEVTVETERGRRLTLFVGDRTRIKLGDDLPGKLADLRKGLDVEVKFDPFSRQAFKIDVEEKGAKAKIEGVIVDIRGKDITVQTEKGVRRTLTLTDRTRIKLEGGLRGSPNDLNRDIKVKVTFDPGTNAALEVEIED